MVINFSGSVTKVNLSVDSRLCNTSWKLVVDMLTRSIFLDLYVLQTSLWHLEDVLKTSWRHVSKTSLSSGVHLEDILKTSWRRLQDALSPPWRRLCKISWRRLDSKTYDWGEYIRLDQDLLKTSWRRIL